MGTDSETTYLPEDIIGAIQLALVCSSSALETVALIEQLVYDYPTDPMAARPAKLFVETVQDLGGEYRLNDPGS